MDKQEILKRYHSAWLYVDDSVIDGSIDSVYDAMDEYAKEECMAYGAFVSSLIIKNVTDHFIGNKWDVGTNAEIYELYIQSKNKK